MMIIIREQPAEGSKQKAGHLALVMLFVVAAALYDGLLHIKGAA